MSKSNGEFNHADGITLKEYVESRLEAQALALKLQTHELDRRLDLLNGEAKRIEEIQRKCVDSRVYSVQHKTLEEKIETQGRLIAIGIGILLAVEFLMRFLK